MNASLRSQSSVGLRFRSKTHFIIIFIMQYWLHTRYGIKNMWLKYDDIYVRCASETACESTSDAIFCLKNTMQNGDDVCQCVFDQYQNARS